tara:strand:- start:1566 stop:1874 length:309 start_codon:yes stop_codon:yes gene_type:complete
MNSDKVFQKQMFSEKQGIALLDPEGGDSVPRTGLFVQNAILIDNEDRFISTIFLKPVTKMASYVVNIEVSDGGLYLVDFRGYRYRFNSTTMMATYDEPYEKY